MKKFKVNDKVIYRSCDYVGGPFRGVVTKVNPRGMAEVKIDNGRTIFPSGDELSIEKF